MHKDFDTWNKEKKRVHTRKARFYTVREIWWCALGVNVGFEQDGAGVDHERPVLIVRGVSEETCFVVPLTTSTHRHRYRIRAGIVDDKDASAIVSQLRLIDTKRLTNKIGFLEPQKFKEIRKAVRDMF